MLAIFRRTFLGTPRIPHENEAIDYDLRPREWALLLVIGLLMLGFGFYPAPLLQTIEHAASSWAAGFAAAL